jgi:hypothetical protein
MHRRRRAPAATLLACTLLLAAGCGPDSDGDDGGADDGGDDGGDDDGGSGGTLPDGGPGAPDGGGTIDADIEVDCPDDDLGALGAMASAVGIQEPFDVEDPDGAQVRILSGDFGPDRPAGMLLVDGRGPFKGTAAVPGSYKLGEAETSLTTCGACIQLGVNTAQALVGFLATAGTLTLDAVDTNVTGSASDLTFQQIDPATGALIEGGCTATAESFSFDAVLSNL